jgi:hypothetical protein
MCQGAPSCSGILGVYTICTLKAQGLSAPVTLDSAASRKHAGGLQLGVDTNTNSGVLSTHPIAETAEYMLDLSIHRPRKCKE